MPDTRIGEQPLRALGECTPGRQASLHESPPKLGMMAQAVKTRVTGVCSYSS